MVAPSKRSRDEFQSFYTNCNHITSYMVSLLNLSSGNNILEPCAGDGAFIDQLLSSGHEGEIQLYDMNPESIENLNNKYSSIGNISIGLDDFVFQITSEKYDRIIANPPYGAYQSPEKRKQLKKMYPSVYAKETYGVFLIRALEMLSDGGKLVFIIPDTYLTLHLHQGLRAKLVNNYSIDSITLFPSKFFPGVNFGYAGLSIIEITNAKPSLKHSFKVYEGLKTQDDLSEILKNPKEFEAYQLSYSDIKKTPSFAFFSTKDEWVTNALNTCSLTVGDACSVVTGFYSGNDGKYLRRSDSVTRGVKKYLVADESEIFVGDLNNMKPLEGLDGDRHWVPIVKGGNRRFHKHSEWFMDWSKEAIHDYRVANKKRARFQNSQFYFSEGIGIPMVSSSAITGAMIDGRLFDQSIVGVFPKEGFKDFLLYFLGFFNSNVCNILIRTINASTNNSSNYIKKLPLIIPDSDIISTVNIQVERLLEKSKESEIVADDLKPLDSIFNGIYSTTKSS